MATAPFPQPPPTGRETRPHALQSGMAAFLVSEVAFFSTLLIAYVVFLGQSVSGPQPKDVLSLNLVLLTTACLLSSSVTVHLAEKASRAGHLAGFRMWWSVTIVLGLFFLLGTGYEWYELIFRHHLTISRNLFGTTFFTLVGFHAAHVTAGIIALSILLALSFG